ncbi:MAG: HAD-IA family hydrolase [Lachnospiraceae bacterium]|nr:HAD-IA family hydrolase [Lachnospiraceae bacterium]
MSYKLAVFDMDGTILNTLQDITNAINYALRENGYPERTIDEVRFFVGNGLHKLTERAVPATAGGEDIERVFETLIPYYRAHSADTTKPYDGIKELLQRLKEAGVICAVVSNKANAAVGDLVKDYFDGLFDMWLGESPEIAKKPAPDMTKKVLQTLGFKESEAVYIGDSDVDIMTARNSGLDEILVDWGFRSREFLKEHGAKRIVSSTDEVYKLITE